MKFMSRIPYPSLDGLSQIKHDWIHDPGRKYLLNVTKMTLHVPDGLWQPYSNLARATVQKTTLEKRYKEMVIVRVGYLQNSEYELFHHRSIAANVGVPAEHLKALESDDLSILPAKERALMDFATEVVRNVSPSDKTLAAAQAHFSDSLLFEAVVLIGNYMMTARIIALGGVDLDESPVTTW
jgi:alkylhydroperoxidase family enzyme